MNILSETQILVFSPLSETISILTLVFDMGVPPSQEQAYTTNVMSHDGPAVTG